MGTKFYCNGFKSDFELCFERGISNESKRGAVTLGKVTISIMTLGNVTLSLDTEHYGAYLQHNIA